MEAETEPSPVVELASHRRRRELVAELKRVANELVEVEQILDAGRVPTEIPGMKLTTGRRVALVIASYIDALKKIADMTAREQDRAKALIVGADGKPLGTP